MPRVHTPNPSGGQVVLRGIPVSPGIVVGPTQLVDARVLRECEARSLGADEEVDAEIARFEHAVEKSQLQLRRLRDDFARNFDEKLAGIFDAHLMMLEDPLIVGATREAVRTERVDAASAFTRRVETLNEKFAKLSDPYFKARGSDLLDVATRVLNNLTKAPSGEIEVERSRAVFVAHDLLPSDTASLDPKMVGAFVTDKGGPTSHTAILAKSLGIPAIVGMEKATRQAVDGEPVIVDAVAGRVVFHPSPDTLVRYNKYIAEYREYESRLVGLADQPAETVDGFRVDLAANIELSEELEQVGRFGHHSIGLYRTEYLFLGGRPPDEEEQFEHYSRALKAVGPKNYVIFRTLDLGGDKTIPALPTYEEANPFLGLRATRLCRFHPELLMPQLRALLRASALGNARIMFPMIGSIEELRWCKQKTYEAMEQLEREGIPYNPKVEFGIMVEIPGAALMAGELAKEVNFFSIGTNDLIQYTLAVDRVNDLVAYLYNPYHPSVLRLIRGIINAAHKNGIVANLCGEMASDPISAIILLGMGIDEMSMASSQIPAIKEVIRSFRIDTAHDIAREIVAQNTSEAVKQVIEERILPILEPMRMPKLELPGFDC